MAHQYLAQILTELLPQVLEDGVTVQRPDGAVTLHLRHIDDVIITSGRLVAWDPLWLEETTPPLAVVIPPGRYPVVVTTIDDQIPAYATVRVRQSRPVRWAIARFDEGQDPAVAGADDEIPGYPVDTGIGCFADTDAAGVFARRLATDAEYHMVIAHGMEESDPSGHGWGWGAVSLAPDSHANLVYFSAGAGDGDYATYIGYDADDALVCVTTDFALLWHNAKQNDEE